MIAHTGFARAIYPVHAPTDGDVLFAAATCAKPIEPVVGLTELGMVAANVVARAIARGVHSATRAAIPRRAAGVEGPVRLAPQNARHTLIDIDEAADPDEACPWRCINCGEQIVGRGCRWLTRPAPWSSF